MPLGPQGGSRGDGGGTLEGEWLACDPGEGNGTVDRGGQEITFKQDQLSAAHINYLIEEGTRPPLTPACRPVPEP